MTSAETKVCLWLTSVHFRARWFVLLSTESFNESYFAGQLMRAPPAFGYTWVSFLSFAPRCCVTARNCTLKRQINRTPDDHVIPCLQSSVLGPDLLSSQPLPCVLRPVGVQAFGFVIYFAISTSFLCLDLSVCTLWFEIN